MDFFINWMTVERFLIWKEGLKKLQETNEKITDEDLIETYQDYRNSFEALYQEIDAKIDKIID